VKKYAEANPTIPGALLIFIPRRRSGLHKSYGQVFQRKINNFSTCSQSFLLKFCTIHRFNSFLYSWSKSQVEARSHSNVVACQHWLNSLYHVEDEIMLKTPLAYADRLRIRQPGPTAWPHHPPHIDGNLCLRNENVLY